MGCSSTKNAVAGLEGCKVKSASNSIKGRKSAERSMSTTTEKNSPHLKNRPAEAFIVSLEENDNNNQSELTDSEDILTKVKPPPKRLQRLIAEAQLKADSPTKTIVSLEEKMARAEQRRLEYLQQKINIIQKVNQTTHLEQIQTNADDGHI